MVTSRTLWPSSVRQLILSRHPRTNVINNLLLRTLNSVTAGRILLQVLEGRSVRLYLRRVVDGLGNRD